MKNRKTFINNITKQVQLVGVTKNHDLQEITQLHEDGITIFGENRVQELESKYREGQPWKWHFIGHLQRNKVSQVVDMCSMIHSVDSLRLAKAINKAAETINIKMDVLIQVNVLDETTKFGCSLDDLEALVDLVNNSLYLCLKGFMIMGPTNQSKKETTIAFRKGHELFLYYKKIIDSVDTLSMGMSGDYEIAIKEGATMVRLGSILFNYSKNAHPQ
jgi:pyridoxal phosphate enzyme (YggS family)